MKKLKIITFMILLITIIWGTIFTTDLFRAKNNENPIFSIYVDGYEDGGSKKYIGLFYIVYSLHYENPEMNDEWLNEDGTLQDEYKDKEYVIYKKVVPWFTSIDKVKKNYSKTE